MCILFLSVANCVYSAVERSCKLLWLYSVGSEPKWNNADRKQKVRLEKKQSYYNCVHRKSNIDRPGNESGPLHQEVSKRVLLCHGSATARRLQYESRALWENTWKSVASALTLSKTSSAPSHTAKIINPVTKTHVATRMLFPNVPPMMSDSVAYVESASMKNWWVRYKPYV